MVREIQQPYNNFAETTTTGTGHINFQTAIDIYEAIAAIISFFVFIVWLRLPQQFGLIAIAWLIPCAELPAIVSKVLLTYIYIHFKVMKLKIPVYQGFVAPLIVTGIISLTGVFYVEFIFYPVNETFGMLAALIPTVIIFILIFPFFVYFPLTGLFGAWDNSSLEILRRATKMSGIGKIFSLPMYKLLALITSRCRLHGKFSIDDSEALKEAKELMKIKQENIEKINIPS
jgi:hypothetical protein